MADRPLHDKPDLAGCGTIKLSSGERVALRLGKPRWRPKHSAVNVQGLASFDHRKLSRRMGELDPAQMAEVKTTLRDLLGIKP